MIPLDIEALEEQLAELEFSFHFQKETGQICVDLPVLDGTLPLFIRIYDTGDLLQLALILPIQFSLETQVVVSRLLHVLNKEMDLPGFCLDETMKIVFYRITIPVFEGQIHIDLLKTFLFSIQKIAEQCIPVIAQASSGSLELEEVIQKAQREHESIITAAEQVTS